MNSQASSPSGTDDSQAAAWMVRREDGLTDVEEIEFQAWLAADPAHQQAYAQMCALWQQLGTLAPAQEAMASSVLRTSPGRLRRWLAGVMRGAAMPQLAAAAIAFAMVGAGWWGIDTWRSQPTFEKTYATARGQQKTIALPDGSTMWLDTATQATVVLYRDRREVQLREGQAQFAVQHRDGMRFEVFAGPVRVTVLGTRFAVRHTHTGLQANAASVLVEQGRVQVASSRAGEAQTRQLTAGQAVVSDALGALGPVTASPVATAPWREGRVSFEKVKLSQALAELDRYREGRLRILDPEVGELLVSGSFDLRHLDAFERSLPRVLPVVLRHNDGFTDISAATR